MNGEDRLPCFDFITDFDEDLDADGGVDDVVFVQAPRTEHTRRFTKGAAIEAGYVAGAVGGDGLHVGSGWEERRVVYHACVAALCLYPLA